MTTKATDLPAIEVGHTEAWYAKQWLASAPELGWYFADQKLLELDRSASEP